MNKKLAVVFGEDQLLKSHWMILVFVYYLKVMLDYVRK